MHLLTRSQLFILLALLDGCCTLLRLLPRLLLRLLPRLLRRLLPRLLPRLERLRECLFDLLALLLFPKEYI